MLMPEVYATTAMSKFSCCSFSRLCRFIQAAQSLGNTWHSREEKGWPGCSWHLLNGMLLGMAFQVSQLTLITRENSLNYLLSLILKRYTLTGQETLKQHKYHCHFFNTGYSQLSTNLLCK